MSDDTERELADVLRRPEVMARLRLTESAVARFLAEIGLISRRHASPPHVYDVRDDPKDSPYVDLAVAVGAELVVSRDRQLLALMDTATGTGADFRNRFAHLRIATPDALAAQLHATDSVWHHPRRLTPPRRRSRRSRGP